MRVHALVGARMSNTKLGSIYIRQMVEWTEVTWRDLIACAEVGIHQSTTNLGGNGQCR